MPQLTTNPADLSRRRFLKVAGSAAGGLIVGYAFGQGGEDVTQEEQEVSAARLNAYVHIEPDSAVTIFCPCPEIGQGVRTSLPMIVAEELGARWEDVRVVQAPIDDRYGSQAVGGSDSVRDYWEPLREAGATARELLLRAASAEWNVSTAECVAAGSRVQHRGTGRSKRFGELATAAAKLEPPADVRYRHPSKLSIVGRSHGPVDAAAIVKGEAEYGLDVRIPGMCFAAIDRAPASGAELESYRADAAFQVGGVRAVKKISGLVPEGRLYGAVRPGIAVIADSTWAALKGREALKATWNVEKDGSSVGERLAQALDQESADVLRDEGNALRALSEADRTITAEYELPLLAHACMEPMNFTAHAEADRCRLWGPTQVPSQLRRSVAEILGLEPAAVEVNPTLAGGGFGRRLAYDYGIEAALVSRAAGVPVQVVWSREDDMRHDYFRQPSSHRLQAGLGRDGAVLAWYHRLATASLLENIIADAAERDIPLGLYDTGGGVDIPYDVANIRFDYLPVNFRQQMGSWRSVSHSFNVFAVESFVDELAEAAGQDPLALRLSLLGQEAEKEITLPLPGRRGRPRPDHRLLRRVLQAAAERSGWGDPLPPGHGRGIACCWFKQSYVAHVAEVAVSEQRVRVERIVVALDIGQVINPSGLKAQVEGAVMDGLGTVFHWGVEITNGRPANENFDRYPMPRIDECPEIEIVILPSDREPAGAGEPPYPSVAPAITNAIRAAGGSRIRRLPLDEGMMVTRNT